MSEKKTYSEKLKDPRWQRKRLEILQRDNFECQWCGDKEATLHVHHFYYKKSGNPWDVEDHALVALCESCHSFEHLKGVPGILKDIVCTLSANPKQHGESLRIVIGYCIDIYKK